ncbi:MAG: low-specificity L-threonine aldolase [Pseudomonadota bacterium]
MSDLIDFRSDTVTRPCAKMRNAMADAQVGDDVYGDDPTVNRLEALAADMAGHEAALFCSSGTQTNLLALMTHCQRGDEYIVGNSAHTYKYEAGGAAVLGSIQPQPLDFEPDGTLDLNKVEALIKEDDYHFARTRLLALENTTAGKVIPQSYIGDARAFAQTKNLAFHLDGARAANAAVAQGIELSELTGQFDSVSICLSKGLGAPVGSVLCASRDFIKEARRARKMLGGGMRQAGTIAAAAIYALENNILRLAEDHENAAYLAGKIDDLGCADFSVASVATNMVFVKIASKVLIELNDHLREHGIILINDPDRLLSADAPYVNARLVMHKDVSRSDIDLLIKNVHGFLLRS